MQKTGSIGLNGLTGKQKDERPRKEGAWLGRLSWEPEAQPRTAVRRTAPPTNLCFLKKESWRGSAQLVSRCGLDPETWPHLILITWLGFLFCISSLRCCPETRDLTPNPPFPLNKRELSNPRSLGPEEWKVQEVTQLVLFVSDSTLLSWLPNCYILELVEPVQTHIHVQNGKEKQVLRWQIARSAPKTFQRFT